MPKYFLVAKNGQEARSSRAFSAADVRALKSASDCYTFIGELTNKAKNVGACRAGKRGMAGAPAWWPFGHKKPAVVAKKKRNPMTQRIMYVPQGPSGRMINKLAGAGRKRKRARR